MTEKEKMLNGLLYYPGDSELGIDQLRAKNLYFKYNNTAPDDGDSRNAILRELLGKCGEKVCILPNFYCDYGYNIEIGDHFFANVNCTILDCGKVKIGNHVQIAPNVGIYAVEHPLDAMTRKTGVEYSKPIIIEDNVWIGANSVILAGVTIGENSVIGAGSVVTKDIPANSLAVGNPCKVIRTIENQ